MELYQLEYLVTLAEYGTVSKAAEILLVSQPAITRSIQNLEKELGYPLFDRIKNRLIINDTGELAVKHARKILKEKEKMQNSLLHYQKSKHQISIGACAPAPLWAIKNIFQQHYETMKITSLISEDNVNLIEGFNNHKFSIIILDYPIRDKNLESIKLFDETLHIAVKSDDSLSKLDAITFEELNGMDMLVLSKTGYWMEICKEKLPKSLMLIQDDFAAYKVLQMASSLPTFRTDVTIPKFKNIENRVYIPIMNKEATLSFYAIYKKSNKSIYNIIEKEIHNIPWEMYRNEDYF